MNTMYNDAISKLTTDFSTPAWEVVAPVGMKIQDSTIRKCYVPGNFLYVDKKNRTQQIQIVRVIYANPATIVFWSDGTKTVSKVSGGDVYNKEQGLFYCILKKVAPNQRLSDIAETWIPKDEGDNQVVTLKDARKITREKNS